MNPEDRPQREHRINPAALFEREDDGPDSGFKVAKIPAYKKVILGIPYMVKLGKRSGRRIIRATPIQIGDHIISSNGKIHPPRNVWCLLHRLHTQRLLSLESLICPCTQWNDGYRQQAMAWLQHPSKGSRWLEEPDGSHYWVIRRPRHLVDFAGHELKDDGRGLLIEARHRVPGGNRVHQKGSYHKDPKTGKWV